MKAISGLFLFALILSAWARTAEEWKTRTIYQIITDRFAKSVDDNTECSNLWNYCGGTFKGIERNLDYIQGMGINAIWISPVWQNAPEGYHGYWVNNFYEINENFGTKQDFIDLINACHERDIWVMVDVVPNHVAPVTDNVTDPTGNEDFGSIYPFNDPSHYHIPILRCKDVFENDPDNVTALEYCWLWRLPDLNHENEQVTKMLLDWIRDFIQTYHVDGLRLDALRHVPNWFWHEFSKAAGVYTIGESFHPEISVCAEYQGAIDSLLNFPLQGRLDKTFHEGKSMTLLSKYYEAAATDWPDHTVLGNFVTNHDIPRFLYNNSDIAGFKAVYAFVLTSVGIPSVYYGDEQFFNGGHDPENRGTLWGKMNTESEMYQYLKTIITFRQKNEFYKHEQIERLADDTFYAFSRGEYFFAFTNSHNVQTRTIRNHPYTENTRLCNAFNEKDCVVVRNGEFEVTIMDKQAKILFPLQAPESESTGIGQSIWKGIKNFWNVGFKSGLPNNK